MHGTRQPGEGDVKTSRAQAEGRARNLVGAFGLKREVHSRTGRQRSDQFRCRCYHSFGFFSLLPFPFLTCCPLSCVLVFTRVDGSLTRSRGVSDAAERTKLQVFVHFSLPVLIQPATVWSFSFYHRSRDLSFCSSELIFSRCRPR